MRNWSTNTKELSKDKVKYAGWKLENLINFGAGKSKIDKQQLKRFIPSLDIDPSKKKYLSHLLWRSKQS